MSTAGSFQAWRTSRADAGVDEEVCAVEGEGPDALWPVGAVPCEAPRSTLNLEGLFSPFAARANTLFSFSISATSSRGELTAPLRRESPLQACEMMTAPSAADTIPNGYQPRQLSDRALVFPRSNPCSMEAQGIRDRYLAVLSPPQHKTSRQQQQQKQRIFGNKSIK